MNPDMNTFTWDNFISVAVPAIVDHADTKFDDTVAYYLGSDMAREYEVSVRRIECVICSETDIFQCYVSGIFISATQGAFSTFNRRQGEAFETGRFYAEIKLLEAV